MDKSEKTFLQRYRIGQTAYEKMLNTTIREV